MRTVEVLNLLLDALRKPFEVASTHSNAVRIYSTGQVEAIFMNPELPMVDPKALVDEFEVVAADRNRKRAPVVFLYTNDELVRRYELRKVPESQLVRKPVLMEHFYALLDDMGLTELAVSVRSQRVDERIQQFAAFIKQSEAWVDRLKERLVKS
ncbi:MAG: hypothetical protein ACETWG_06085 [Candidatus Neomarinimicrobiota bacterium]